MAGTRHVAFNANGTLLYVVNELDATINVFAYDAVNGAILDNLQTISTVVEPSRVRQEHRRDSHFHPSGRFLYNSNRGQPDSTISEGDAIVGFSIDPTTGLLTVIGHTIDEIAVPGSFTFDASGRFLYSANYDDSSVTQFRFDQETGLRTFTGNRTEVPHPFVIQTFEPVSERCLPVLVSRSGLGQGHR